MAEINRLEEPPASVTSLVGGIISDAQQLIRQEMALARREIHDEVDKAKTAALSLALGMFTLFFGGVLLSLALVHLLHWLTNDLAERFPLWACYAVIGGVFAVAGALLSFAARNKAGEINLVPPRTAETMKENVQWLKNQT